MTPMEEVNVLVGMLRKWGVPGRRIDLFMAQLGEYEDTILRQAAKDIRGFSGEGHSSDWAADLIDPGEV